MTDNTSDQRKISFSGEARTTGWLDFDMPDGRHIVLRAKLNQAPTDVIIDSGVGRTVLDQAIAAQLGVHVRGALVGMGVTASVQAALGDGISLSIGNLEVRAPETSIVDLSTFSAVTGRTIVAIVGRDLFDQLIAEIDFTRKKIAFYDHGPIAPEKLNAATTLPLTRTDLGIRTVPISIAGRPPIPAIFDLGSDTLLYQSRDYVEQQKLLVGRQTSTSLRVRFEIQG